MLGDIDDLGFVFGDAVSTTGTASRTRMCCGAGCAVAGTGQAIFYATGNGLDESVNI
jgi:hypothetical protein